MFIQVMERARQVLQQGLLQGEQGQGFMCFS
jgi:hypothetical protein